MIAAIKGGAVTTLFRLFAGLEHYLSVGGAIWLLLKKPGLRISS